MKSLKMSICVPTYHGIDLIDNSLKSIFSQKFKNYQIIISNDSPDDHEQMEKKLRKYTKKGIKIALLKNKKNLGYPLNLRQAVSKAKGDIVFLMAQDDILSINSLQKTHDAFLLDKKVGVVTRPYFWFMEDVNKPVRAITPYDPDRDSVLSIFDGQKEFLKIFESVGQLSGLAYRKKFLSVPFHHEVFPAHIYPFAGILRKYKCVYLKDYTVAVGIKASQTRSLSSIYDLSPTESWIKMYQSVFSGQKYKQQRSWGVEHMATNFLGLVQLKNYAKAGVLIKEIKTMVKNRWQILFNPKFWFFSLGCIVTPRCLLIPVVDWYKDRLNSRKLKNVKFNSPL